MNDSIETGILGLQGDVQEMFDFITNLDLPLNVRIVRNKQDLKDLQFLIVPGGESGTILRVLKRRNMLDDVLSLLNNKCAFFGTCAGLIVFAELMKMLQVPTYRYQRNFDGRQIYSRFRASTLVDGKVLHHPYVRAPLVLEILNKDFEIISVKNERPDAIRSRRYRCLMLAGHPELNNSKDSILLEFFTELISNRENNE